MTHNASSDVKNGICFKTFGPEIARNAKAAGHKAKAADCSYSIRCKLLLSLTGFGKSKSARFRNKRDFVERFLKELNIDRPVLVSASMSGSYALPFLLRPEARTCTQRLRGFVPIAPVDTSTFTRAEYSSCNVSFT